GDGVEVVEFVHAIGHGIGEWVLLGVEGAGLDAGDRLGQIAAHWHGAEQFEGPGLYFARQYADAHILEIRRHLDAAQAIRDLAKAVLVPAEDAVIHARLDL